MAGGKFNSLKPGYIIEMNGIDVPLVGAVPNADFVLNNLEFSVKMIREIGQDVLGKIVENKIKNRSSNQVESILVKSETGILPTLLP